MIDKLTPLRDALGSAQLASVLATCRQQGFTRPYVITLVHANGSLTAYRDDGTGDSKLLVERFVGDGLKLPLAGLLVDATGKWVGFPIDLPPPAREGA